MAFKPLKITWELATPMVEPSHLIHLDALLAFAAVSMAGMDISAQENLPLAKESGVWQASALHLIPQGDRQSISMTRKLDPFVFAQAIAEGIIDAGNANYPDAAHKGRIFNHITRLMKAEAWCIGDEKEIKRHLNHMECLGKLSRLKHGRVRTITIEEDQAALERWRWRVLPQGQNLELPHIQYTTVAHPIKPPYWDKTNQVMASMPVKF